MQVDFFFSDPPNFCTCTGAFPVPEKVWDIPTSFGLKTFCKDLKIIILKLYAKISSNWRAICILHCLNLTIFFAFAKTCWHTWHVKTFFIKMKNWKQVMIPFFYRRIRTSITNLFDKKQKRPSGTLTDVVTYIPNSVNSMSSASNLENRVVNANNFCRWDDHHFKAANRLSQTGSVVTESTTASRNNVRELEFLRPCGSSLSYDKGCYDTPKVHLESCAFHQVEKKWEFPRCNLIWEKTIGEGEFGKVMSAKAIDRSLTKGK